MPIYRCEALDARGKRIVRMLDAESERSAKELLIREGFHPMALALSRRSELRLTADQLRLFTRELVRFLKAGVPLHDTLKMLAEKRREGRLRLLLLDLADRLQQGKSFSAALGYYPRLFNPVYLALVHAGEQSGHLSQILSELADEMEERARLRRAWQSALAYPGLLLLLAFIITGGLFFFVIPSLAELFEDRQLHPISRAVLWISGALVSHSSLVMGLLLTVVSSIVLLIISSEMRRRIVLPLLHRLPFISDLMLATALQRFSSVAALLLRGGVPLAEAIQLALPVASHSALEKQLREAREQMVEGESFSSALATRKLLPPLLVRMVATGEQTGGMAHSMTEVSSWLADDLKRSLTTLLAFLQPTLLLLLGLIIGIVLLGLLVPLTDVSSFLES